MESSNSWRTIRTITTVSLIIAWKMLMKLAMILRKATKRHIQNRKKQTRKSSNLWKSFRQHQSEQAFQSCCACACNSLCNSWITWQIVVVELFTFFSLALMKDGHGWASIFERMDSTSKGYLYTCFEWMFWSWDEGTEQCAEMKREEVFSQCVHDVCKSSERAIPYFLNPHQMHQLPLWFEAFGFLQFWHF